MPDQAPPGSPPAEPLAFRRLGSWLAACLRELKQRGGHGGLTWLAELMDVTPGQARNILQGRRRMNPRSIDRLGAAWALSQDQLAHIIACNQRRLPATPVAPTSPAVRDRPSRGPRGMANAGALPAAALIAAALGSGLSKEALAEILWPPLNVQPAGRLLRAARRRGAQARALRPFGPGQRADHGVAQHVFRSASRSFDAWTREERRIRTLTFSMTEPELAELAEILNRHLTAFGALGGGQAPEDGQVMQLFAALSPLSRPWRPTAAPAPPPPPALEDPLGPGPVPEDEPRLLREDDPVTFLLDWLRWRRGPTPSPAWSLEAIARRARATSGHLNNVLKRRKPLTERFAEQLLPVLGLKGEDAVAWRLMVRRARSASLMERAACTLAIAKLEGFRRARSPDQLAALALRHFPCSALYALASGPGAPRALEALVELLGHELPEAKIRDAAEQLEWAGLLVRGADGELMARPAPFSWIGGEIERDLQTAFHREALSWADQHLSEDPHGAWGMRLALIPAASLPLTAKVLEALYAELLALTLRADASPAPGPRRLFLLSLGMLPASRRFGRQQP